MIQVVTKFLFTLDNLHTMCDIVSWINKIAFIHNSKRKLSIVKLNMALNMAKWLTILMFYHK